MRFIKCGAVDLTAVQEGQKFMYLSHGGVPFATILLRIVVLKNVFDQGFLSVELIFRPFLPDRWTLEDIIRVSFHMVGEVFSLAVLPQFSSRVIFALGSAFLGSIFAVVNL